MTHPSKPSPADPLARIRQAIDNAFRQVGLTPPRIVPPPDDDPIPPPAPARQTLPNPATARQTTPAHQKLQNEPTAATAARTAPHPPSLPTITPTRQSAPNPAIAPHAHQICKTNPPRPLTPNQLRAARLLVAGHATLDIAAQLQVNPPHHRRLETPSPPSIAKSARSSTPVNRDVPNHPTVCVRL